MFTLRKVYMIELVQQACDHHGLDGATRDYFMPTVHTKRMMAADLSI